jgi:transcription elongation factor GreA
VAQGQVVTVRFPDGDEERFLLGSREEAVHASIDVYSPTSPLGKAVLGAQVGTEVSYNLPNGGRITVVVVATEPYSS